MSCKPLQRCPLLSGRDFDMVDVFVVDVVVNTVMLLTKTLSAPSPLLLFWLALPAMIDMVGWMGGWEKALRDFVVVVVEENAAYFALHSSAAFSYTLISCCNSC